ncbi:MAG: ceramidase domain-containing protein [Chitinophagales bacterium]
MDAKRTNLYLSIIIFILSSVLVYLGIVNHWFGETRPGLMKFCEFAREGLIKQPANSFSNLGFSLAGLLIAYQLYQNKFRATNLLTQHLAYSFLFIFALLITGAGSFAMHATNAHWGGFADLFGMFLIAAFMCSYALSRLFSLSSWSFGIIFLIGVVFSSVVYLSPSLNFKGFMSGAEVCFIFMILVAILVELYLALVKKIKITRTYGYFALFSLLLAFLIWNLSLWPDSLLCKPHSLLQGHAAWHLLDALGAYFVFRFYASEELNPKV